MGGAHATAYGWRTVYVLLVAYLSQTLSSDVSGSLPVCTDCVTTAADADDAVSRFLAGDGPKEGQLLRFLVSDGSAKRQAM